MLVHTPCSNEKPTVRCRSPRGGKRRVDPGDRPCGGEADSNVIADVGDGVAAKAFCARAHVDGGGRRGRDRSGRLRSDAYKIPDKQCCRESTKTPHSSKHRASSAEVCVKKKFFYKTSDNAIAYVCEVHETVPQSVRAWEHPWAWL